MSKTRSRQDLGRLPGSCRGLLLALGCLLCGCGDEPLVNPAGDAQAGASSSPAPEVVAGPRVVFLGDSLTAGLHLPSDQAYPAVLERRLAARGVPIALVNAGISGDTTAGGLARLDWLLKQEPDLLVVALGVNDGLRGQPVTSIEQNLRAICERALASGTRVCLLGMRLPPNYGFEYTSEFAALFDRVAAQLELPYLPFYIEGVGGHAELLLEDGLHPTAEGHERIASNLEPLLVELLAR